eukprot:11351705-Alexandrium_andersonii.AAC.1
MEHVSLCCACLRVSPPLGLIAPPPGTVKSVVAWPWGGCCCIASSLSFRSPGGGQRPPRGRGRSATLLVFLRAGLQTPSPRVARALWRTRAQGRNQAGRRGLGRA